MRKLIYLFVFCFMFILCYHNSFINASSDSTNVHLIFNKTSFNKGEEIKLSINLENFSNLNETKVIIKCDEKVFKPVKKNECYGHLVNNSIYEDILVNEYHNGYLRFQLIKKDLSSGYFSGFKNNVGEFYFIACINISNIYDYFTDGSFSILSSGINITLYDVYNEYINTNIIYSEKINVGWDIEKYEVEVYSKDFNFIDDIVVYNRSENEYEILKKEEVDLNHLNSSIINIIIIDKRNADIVVLSKRVDVVDTTKPIISGDNNILIDSNKLSDFYLDEHFEITDNYDLAFSPNIKYYDTLGNEILSYIDFINYLSHNLNAKVLISVSDVSGNKSDDFYIDITINDVTAPNIGEIKSFIVEDYNLSTFDFKNEISVSDDYDLNPTLIIKYYVDLVEIKNIEEELLKEKIVKAIYYAQDNKNNKTKEYECIIKIKDTMPPVISRVEEITLTDKEIINYEFTDKIKISDNLDRSPDIILEYYVVDEKIEYHKWIDKVSLGEVGYIIYYGKDKSNNVTEKVKLNVTVNDTTPPVIIIDNIKNGGKYIVGKTINYRIVDNFIGKLNTVVMLNNKIYNNEEINNPGEYTFKVESIDNAGNKNIVIINFKVIENNFIGCGDDLECYKDNYLEVVLLSIVLLIVVITIFVIKLLINKKKKKKVVINEKIDN